MIALASLPKAPGPRYGRRRAAVLIGVHLLIAVHFLHWKLAGRTLAPVELNEVLHTLHGGIVTVGFLFMAAAVASTLVFGRFFCSWGCHMLALQDAAAWLLSKAGVRPRPVRFRALRWVPALALAYLAVWPQLERLAAGRPHPGWRVLSDAQGWGSFATSDLTRNLPGPAVAALTFAVGAGLLIYLLGTRSFCQAACPYGALFAAADRAAPGRIRLDGPCTDCGRCTASCPSQVGVHEEVRRHRAVLDPSCLKCLACVEACPTGALGFGMTKPLLLRPGAEPASSRRESGFSALEQAVFGAAALGAFLSYRGLYGAVPFLLALPAAILAGWAAVVAARLAARPDVTVQRWTLKESGRLRARGWAAVAVLAAAGSLTAHSAFVRHHERRAEILCRRLSQSGFTEETAREARRHLRSSLAAGLLEPPPARAALARIEVRLGLSAPPPAGERSPRGTVKEER